MAESDSAPWLRRPAAQDVADSTGGSTITVHSGAWSAIAPHLTAEAVAMLAPPVSVSADPVATAMPAGSVSIEPSPSERRRADAMRYRMNMPSPPSGKHRRTRTG